MLIKSESIPVQKNPICQHFIVSYNIIIIVFSNMPICQKVRNINGARFYSFHVVFSEVEGLIDQRFLFVIYI